MTDEATKQQPQNDAVKEEHKPKASSAEAPNKGDDSSKPERKSGPENGPRGARRGGRGGKGQGRGKGGPRGRMPKADVPAESDYEEKNIEISRVTRVTKGGKRMRFRVLAVIGNHKGRVGFGMAKGLDVQSAMAKATGKARKSLINVPIEFETIPHPIRVKYGAAEIVMKPAPKGTGVKAGGPVRTTLELAGIPNITAKILGTTNKVSNVKAVFKALSELKPSNRKQKGSDESAVKEQITENK